MSPLNTEAILERRDYFPRGLLQPENGYRFSLDSLLLAAFVHVGRKQHGVDLGCGCGVIGLGLLLRHPDLKMTSVELNPGAVAIARENVVNLHFPSKMTVEQGDVEDWHPEDRVDFVVANPPYRELGKGRASQGGDRKAARFEDTGTFAQFARCAALSLKTRGKFTFVQLPERLPELLATVSEFGLVPKRMRLVHGRREDVAKIVLVETLMAAKPGLQVEPPLILHEGRGKKTRFTRQALDFCPFLRCNSGEEDA